MGSYMINDNMPTANNPKLTKYVLIANGLTAPTPTQSFQSSIPKEYCFYHNGEVKDYRVAFGLRADSNRLLSQEAFDVLYEDYIYKNSKPDPRPVHQVFVEDGLLPNGTFSSGVRKATTTATQNVGASNSNKSVSLRNDKSEKSKPKIMDGVTSLGATFVDSSIVIDYYAYLVVPLPGSTNNNPLLTPPEAAITNDELSKFITKYYYSSISVNSAIVFSPPQALEGANQPYLQTI